MNYDEFKDTIRSFADTPASIDIEKGTLVLDIRGEHIEAELFSRFGDVHVRESQAEYPAPEWIFSRVARLPILADRIIDHIDDEPHFINPSGRLLDRVDRAESDEEVMVKDVQEAVLRLLAERPAGTSTGLYVTSDAGEGKTTLIRHLALHQARLYREKRADWLIVPIPLGGRTLLRFDDVIIGALVNTMRFPFLYYEAFVRLVRMGAIVPALDGFEEMFVESQAGDAISALGNLMDMLSSEGTILIAARRAYFEYKSLQVQAPLFESIRGQSAEFARLHLERWSREQFIEYAARREFAEGARLFAKVAGKLGAEHPLLTRAVLVRRLIDVALDGDGQGRLVESIGGGGEDYFYQFVESILEREANEKWINKAGDPARPLLSVIEHGELLADVAHEMWVSETSMLKADVLESVAEVYCEGKRLDGTTTNQVIERVKQHALIVEAEPGGRSFRFDHEEFYHFFLGQSVSRLLAAGDVPDIRYCLRIGRLPDMVGDSATRSSLRDGDSRATLVAVLNRICESEPHASFVRENGGSLALAAIDGSEDRERVLVARMLFGVDSLRNRKLENVEFAQCDFRRTEVAGTELKACRFTRCRFEEIDVSGVTAVVDTVLDECECYSVIRNSEETAVYAPDTISRALQEAGFAFPEVEEPDVEEEGDAGTEEELVVTERMCRIFYRSTGVNENTFRQRLGSQVALFFDAVLPALVRQGVVQEVQYAGGGQQKRYQLAVSLRAVQEAIERSDGSFQTFLEELAG